MPRNLDQVMEQYRNVGNMNVPTPQPPPYMIPNAFQSASHQMRPPMDRMGAMIGGFATNADDIVAARGRDTAGSWGRGIGTAIGFGVGTMTGSPWGAAMGASTGNFLGGMAGGALGYIPGVNQIFRGYQRMRWGGAIDQMAGMNTIQQGMYGRVSMMGGDSGAGGTGVNPMAALQLSQSFGGAPGGRQQMSQLTAAAAETGFLDTASNMGQITNVVKKLAGVMGEMAKLTGDPDFRNNLRELSNMRNMGLTVDQSLRSLKDMRMYGKMAGGMDIAQGAAGRGAALYQQYGLTGGLGSGMGASAAGMAGVGMGGLSPIERGLYGGQEGVTNTMMGGQAQYLGSTAKMFLPYLVERGAGGALQINQERLKNLRSPGADLGGFMRQGQANLAQMGPDAIQDLMNNMPALQTQMGQSLGQVGTFATMAALTRQIQKQTPGLSLQSAAGVATRDRATGNLLATQMNDPVMIGKAQAQLDAERIRTRQDAREQRTEQLAQEPGLIGRKWAQYMESQNTQGGWLAGSNQGAEAWEQAASQQRALDAAQGIRRRIPGAGGDIGAGELALVKGRMDTSPAGMEAANERYMQNRSMLTKFMHPGQGLTNLDAFGRAKAWHAPMDAFQIGYGGFKPLEGEFAALDIAKGQQPWYSPSESTRFAAGLIAPWGESNPERNTRLASELANVRTGGEAMAGLQKYTAAQFSQFDNDLKQTLSVGKKMGKKRTANVISLAKSEIIQHAHEKGADNQAVDANEVKRSIIRSFIKEGGMDAQQAQSFFDLNEKQLMRQAYHWIDASADRSAQKALGKTADADGARSNAVNIKNIEENEAGITKEARLGYEDVGLTESTYFRGALGAREPDKPEEAGIKALYAEADPETRALAMMVGGMPGEGDSGGLTDAQRAALGKVHAGISGMAGGDERLAKAKKLAASFTSSQRARMARVFGGRLAEGEGYGTIVSDLDQGMKGEGRYAKMAGRVKLGALELHRKKAGVSDVTEEGAGAGAKTNTSEARLKELDAQGAMLSDMTANMNKAAAALLQAAAVLSEKALVKAIKPYATKED